MIDDWLAQLPPLPNVSQIKEGDTITINWGNGVRESMTVEERSHDSDTGESSMTCRTEHIEYAPAQDTREVALRSTTRAR